MFSVEIVEGESTVWSDSIELVLRDVTGETDVVESSEFGISLPEHSLFGFEILLLFLELVLAMGEKKSVIRFMLK